MDDSPIMLNTLGNIMAKERGFHVVGTAKDGLKAVLAAASLMPQLVLMDLHMRHLDGAQATRRLKQFHNPPVVFMVTSDDSPSARTTATAAGADALLVKSGDLQARLRSKLFERFGPLPAYPQVPAAPGLADRLPGTATAPGPSPSAQRHITTNAPETWSVLPIDGSGKEVALPPPPPLRTGREDFPSSGSS